MSEPTNPLEAIPDSNLPTWVIGWRGRITRDVGTDYIVAEHAERAKREYEREHPTREVTNVYQSLATTSASQQQQE